VPLLTDPMAVFNLLLGNVDYLEENPVTFFIYNLPQIEFGIDYFVSFPIFPGLNAGLDGAISIGFDLSFGFDSYGITQFQESGDVADIFNGFFIVDDPDLTDGVDPDEVYVSADIGASAFLGIGGLVEAGVRGGVNATVGLDLHDTDGDGLFRASEFVDRFILGPVCMFDMDGQVSVGLDAFLWVGLKIPFVGKITLFSESFNLFSAVIADFHLECPPADVPILTDQSNVVASAIQDPAGDIGDTYNTVTNGVLTLNMGDRAGDRVHGDTTDGAERFEVIQLVDANGVTVTRVKYAGFTEEYVGVTDIVIDGGDGDDQIVLVNLTDAIASVTINADDGNDLITATGAAQFIYVSGGDDDDSINIEAAEAEVHGGSGDDIIMTGIGDDTVYGGAGTDRITTGDGADEVWGGDEPLPAGFDPETDRAPGDIIDTGDGVDTIHAGGGADLIDAGEGDDIIFGDSGEDLIIWSHGDGADDIDGGGDTDKLILLGDEDPGGLDLTITVSDDNGDIDIDWGSTTLDVESLEHLDLTAGTGSDTVTIEDISGTDLMHVDIGLGGAREFDATSGELILVTTPDGEQDTLYAPSVARS
jgi:Ca2+-binding RTX toxin-like protein